MDTGYVNLAYQGVGVAGLKATPTGQRGGEGAQMLARLAARWLAGRERARST